MNLFWSTLGCIFLGCLLSQVATLATTMYLHRGSTHQSVTFHPVAEFFLQLNLWITTGIKRMEWVSVHLYHHLHTDVEGDPHSPVVHGFWRVQLGNLFLYTRAAKDPKILRYGIHIRPTWAERTIFKFGFLGPTFGILVACLVFGWVQGLVLSFTHAVLYLFFLNNLVNGLCHHSGYKNFPEASAFNNRWVAWITGGEGNHNNHHENPASPKLSVKPWEPDLGWRVIQVLERLHLAKCKPGTLAPRQV